MRFRRRDADVDAASVEDDAPAIDAPPPGAPVAAFAGVLDGRRLWVAVDARPGSIGLRDPASGDVVGLPDDAADDQPAYLSARLDLAGLPDADAVYDVVLVPTGGGRARPVWTPPLPERRSPLAADGRTRHVLVRGDDGALRLRRETAKPAADLVGVTSDRTSVTLRLAGAESPLALVVEGEVVASWDGEVADGVLTVTLGPDALDGLEPATARAAVGEGRLGVRRVGDDLLDPARAALLPPLYARDGEAQRMRLRWSPQGFLQARIFAETAADDGEAES